MASGVVMSVVTVTAWAHRAADADSKAMQARRMNLSSGCCCRANASCADASRHATQSVGVPRRGIARLVDVRLGDRVAAREDREVAAFVRLRHVLREDRDIAAR